MDSDGNVYVANRHFEGNKPLVMKVLSTGGIDRNGNAIIDTSSDINGDGIISGAELLPLADTNGNGMIDTAEIQDERVAWAVQVGNAGSLGRALCIGTDSNIWLGTYNDLKYYKVSSADGSLLGGPYAVGVTPYGCLIDGSGTLWSANLGSYLGKLDTSTGTMSGPYYHGFLGSNYGIAIGNSKVYLGGTGYSYIIFDPTTNSFSENSAVNVYGLGVAVDGNGDIFVGANGGGMYKFKPDGTLLWSAPAQAGTGHIRGVVVDGSNNVWTINLNESKVSKYNGATGAALGVFPVGLYPYTYSDAAGLAALSTTTPTGYWTVVYDGGVAGTSWGTASWNGSTPTSTTLEVRVRTDDTVAGLDFQTYQLVSNAVQFTATGRYIQIQVKFSASTAGTSPILYDLTVQTTAVEPTPTPTPTPTPAPEGKGFMTGGGNITQGSGKAAQRYTWGFEVRCDASQGNFQYNDHAQKGDFHLEAITSVTCTDDASISPNPPGASFDTLHLTGTGRWNGGSGATIDVTLKDAGEPGKNDTIDLTIKTGTTVVSQVSGKLSGGNLQAHD